MAQLTQWLWRQEYWLPPGITWADMQETEDVRYPQPQHLLLGLPITLLLLVLRFFFKRNISVPLSKKLGLREKLRQKPSPNPILEAFYTKRRRSPQKEEVTSLAQQCDLQPRQVERWLRSRRNQDRPSLTKKFCEASWRATYCITSFCMGLAILHDKPWFWDDRECWVGYPQQPLQPSISGYYLTQFSFCCSLVILLPFDVKRMDFHEQMVHHVATLLLISFSYCVNYIRMGSRIMILHDISDCFLEAAKMFHYLKWQKTCDALFVTFSAVFLFTRLVIFPYKILYNTYYYSMELCQPFFGYYFFNTLLMVLQLLHVFWSCLIIRMVYRFLIHGTAEKDVRSDSEGSEDDEDEADRKAE
ncbi:ceramide synthase 4 isoform X1 [Candoia aspera]|uniref:ceramide synthase 4 isoform X1 n=1 Tax=Candoia aspera TaxID=51853 RepID=UPI002FD83674